ncbi:hypothetical protein ACHAXA_001423 [Cyclostephanos tholiformis]|uniref:PUM-HD domain-containing protein n=1 Tax=Cyclostephanos tholiformis TaxID=382380 RepID=A0ABD3RGA0_9STRA
MNTNILDIIAGEARDGIASSEDDGGVDDILGRRPRSTLGGGCGNNNIGMGRGGEEEQRPRQLRGTTTNYFGLNLGRSQSAAPETWEYAKFTPSSTRSTVSDMGVEGVGGRLFGGGGGGGRHRGFFDEEEEDQVDALMAVGRGVRRPASTGFIGQRRGSNNEDVDSILETLGLTSLDPMGKPTPLDGMVDRSRPPPTPSLVLGAHHSPVKSIMEKILIERQDDAGAHYFSTGDQQRGGGGASSRSGDVLFPNNNRGIGGGGVSPNTLSSTTAAQQYQLDKNQSSLGLSIRQLYHHDQLPFDSQQQRQQLYYSQDYRAQQQANMNVMQGGTVLRMNPDQQQTIYHINSPSVSSYGFDYQTTQHPHLHQHVVPTNHILLPQHQQISVGGAQYISIVPIQAAQFGGGHPGQGTSPQTYAYVQYGNGAAPPTLVSTTPLGGGGIGPGTATTYVMSPNGPIAVSSGGAPPGLAPISIINYGGGQHHLDASPATGGGGGMRTPTRGGGGGANNLKSPDRTTSVSGGGGGRGGWGNKRNAVTSPRGPKQQRSADKSVSTPSKLGPEASHLLNEIRGAKSRSQWTIHDIRSHIVEFCLDQNGSRFIQQRLEVADPNEKDAVMCEIIPAMEELHNDVFGNYVVQKLYEFGTPSMKKDLKGTLIGNMLHLSLEVYGCRVIQKALESLDYDDLCELILEFDSYVLTCIQDQNGNHVMQKCIEVMSLKAKDSEFMSGDVSLSSSMSQRIQFIVNDVLANVKTLCCHPYGCRVLQRMLEHCVESQKTATLDEIQRCHKALLDDQYGNYVIQHVLQYGRESDRDSLLNIIVENDLLKLSRQKFASNVVEKLLKFGNSRQRNAIVREMLKLRYEGQDGVSSSVLLLMVRDAYANYVVQTAIDVVPDGNEKRMLLEELKSNEAQLRNYTFAKHIVAKLGPK